MLVERILTVYFIGNLLKESALKAQEAVYYKNLNSYLQEYNKENLEFHITIGDIQDYKIIKFDQYLKKNNI